MTSCPSRGFAGDRFASLHYPRDQGGVNVFRVVGCIERPDAGLMYGLCPKIVTAAAQFVRIRCVACS